MTEIERLARFVRLLSWAVLAGLAASLTWDVATGTLPFRSRIDPDTGSAGLLVETDAGTGCQYIVTPWGGIVPRAGRDGRPNLRARQMTELTARAGA